jgi:peptide/nickel transport system substrate-binding protein
LNVSTPQSNLDINAKIALATQSSFNHVDADLKLGKDPSFGTYKVVSKDPLTVKYTLSDKAQWSDGVPVTAADVLLNWAVVSGYYDSASFKADGSVKDGTQYFTYAGTTLPNLMTKFPTISNDDKSITVTYKKPYADWETNLGFAGDPMIPAHVVWKKAGITSAAGFEKFLKGVPAGDTAKPAPTNAKLKKMANFWNSGFDTKTLPSDKSLYLSDGPYIISAIDPGKSVTLVPNKMYKGAHPAKLSSIVMRTIGDAEAQVQALQNGEVDVIAPQADADTLQSLKSMQNVNLQQGSELAYDHVDLKFNGVFKDKTIREAFLKTIPREKILNAIVTPMDPSAKVLNSQIFVPSQPGYAGSVANNGSSAFGAPDIAGAKKLLHGRTPTVDILYASDNPNRVNAFTLIADSAKEAGFKIKNDGDPKWGSRLASNSYDASIFGWINPGVGVSGFPQIFGTRQGGNYNNFSDPKIDQLDTKLLQTMSKSAQTPILQQIDKQLFSDDYGLPLFQEPGLTATDNRVQGITQYDPSQSGVWWNVADWSVKNS